MRNSSSKKKDKSSGKSTSNSKPKGNANRKEMVDVAVPSSPKDKDKNKKLVLPPLAQKTRRSILDEMKGETEKMVKDIDQLEKKDIFERETTIAQLESLNKIINSKSDTIKKLADENQELFNQLKDIRNEADEKLQIVKIFKVKENALEKREKALQKEVKVIDEELKVAKKNIELYKNEKEYYEKLVKVHADNSVMSNLIEEIQKKKESIIYIKKRISSLEKIRKQHKNCDIKQKQLQKEIDLMENELEFERKRKIAISESMSKVDQVSKRYHDSEDITFITLSKNNNNKERTKRSQSPERKILANNKSIKTLRVNLIPIHQEFNAINENYKKYCSTSVLIPQNKMSDSEKLKMVLFKEEEKVVLEKLIPNSKLEAYQRRFDEIEEQKKELEAKIKNRNIMKQFELKENKEKYISTELQVTEQKKRSSVLNSQRAALNKDISVQKGILKKSRDNLKFYLDLYKIKQKENEKLFQHLKEIQAQIDSGELVLKPSDENDEEEEDPNNKDDDDNGDGNEQDDQDQNYEEIDED